MTKQLKDKIKKMSQEMAPDLVKIRRHIHEHPELSYQEYETMAYVSKILKEHNIPHKTGVAGTGVVGLIEGKGKGPVVALRADMDALPIEEQNDVPYKSKNPGVMHACGHDSHTTVLLGAAILLNSLRETFSGTVKLIFQPGEEKNPGGASLMVKAGVMENPKVDMIFGLHSDPRYRPGEIGYRYGAMMAEPDEISITIKGKSGHGASPHLAVDPIVIAAEVILGLQKIASRMVDPTEKIVVTIGKIEGGHTTNVIPDEVHMLGTVRTLNPELTPKIPPMMEQIIKGITEAYGASYEFKYDFGYPVVMNDTRATDILVEAGKKFLGEENVKEVPKPSMGGEDFSFYLQKAPGSFYRLGTGNPEKGITEFWHNSRYNIDEDALPVGAGFMTYLALEALEKL